MEKTNGKGLEEVDEEEEEEAEPLLELRSNDDVAEAAASMTTLHLRNEITPRGASSASVA